MLWEGIAITSIKPTAMQMDKLLGKLSMIHLDGEAAGGIEEVEEAKQVELVQLVEAVDPVEGAGAVEATKQQQTPHETPIHLRDRTEFWAYIESSPMYTNTTNSTVSLRWVSDTKPPPVYCLPKIHISYANKVKLGLGSTEVLQNGIAGEWKINQRYLANYNTLDLAIQPNK